MSRKEPTINPPIVRNDELAGWVRQVRKYKVITPLFGGGEETQRADSITVVRATEVRGHLRFWWRATRGGAFSGDLEKMQEAEEKIWGSSGGENKPGASQIVIRVVEWKQGKSIGRIEINTRRGKEMVDIGEPKSPWSYVAFPLREEKDENGKVKKPAGSVVPDVEFVLEIKYPLVLKDEVESSLWAWETFGGIGARTRRGFGSLSLSRVDKEDKITPKASELEKNIRAGLDKYVAIENKWPNGVPHLSKRLRFKTTARKDTALSSWELLFKAFKEFRQFRYEGSNSPYGRSQWPEPDAIRRLPGIPSANKHKTPRSSVDKFPRGKFGLPINFKFKDDNIGDPKPSILQGAKLEGDKYIDRLASPLILRPIVSVDGAVGLAAILEWKPVNSKESYTPPGGLLLTSSEYGDFPVESNLDPIEATHIPPLEGETDVLQAFLNSLK